MRARILAATLGTLLLIATDAAPIPWISERIWFTPGPGTPDMLRLFDSPDQWPRARQTIDVFEFYQGHTRTIATAGEGPNRYDAFVRADAFRKLLRWGKRIAIEVASVKDAYCTPDDSGMRESIAATLESMRNVQAAGGWVSFLSMDEPFFAGRSPRCGGPALDATADRLATYVAAVKRAYAGVKIGLIEPYPAFAPADFARMIDLLRARGAAPDFLHIDPFRPDLPQGRDFSGELLALADLASRNGIPFGVIIWGDNGDADALYAADALRSANDVADTFGSWNAMPRHVIIQSWAQSRTGQFITPSNLPETDPNSHTGLVGEIYRLLRTSNKPPRTAASGI